MRATRIGSTSAAGDDDLADEEPDKRKQEAEGDLNQFSGHDEITGREFDRRIKAFFPGIRGEPQQTFLVSTQSTSA
ncbi:MAG: hypothetical protein AAFX06_11265 [Planctomycetota bacterium]